MDMSQRTKRRKLTNAEIQDRVDHIISLLAMNKKRSQILVDTTVISWQLTNASIDKYIKHARDDIALNARQGRQEHLSRAILDLEYLYKVNLEREDYNQALACRKELNRLLKLDEVYRPTEEKEIENTPKEVEALIDEIRIVNPPDHDEGYRERELNNVD